MNDPPPVGCTWLLRNGRSRQTPALMRSLTWGWQVARELLSLGLEGMDGVVFVDDVGTRVVLLRSGRQVVRLARCGLPPERRFTFYDQLHTTGMDIPQPISGRAMQTLGKDVTFRDLAQGAYRMRGIGNGQQVHLLLIPEVLRLVVSEAATATAGSRRRVLAELERMPEGEERTAHLLRQVLGWVLVRAFVDLTLTLLVKHGTP